MTSKTAVTLYNHQMAGNPYNASLISSIILHCIHSSNYPLFRPWGLWKEWRNQSVYESRENPSNSTSVAARHSSGCLEGQTTRKNRPTAKRQSPPGQECVGSKHLDTESGHHGQLERQIKRIFAKANALCLLWWKLRGFVLGSQSNRVQNDGFMNTWVSSLPGPTCRSAAAVELHLWRWGTDVRGFWGNPE